MKPLLCFLLALALPPAPTYSLPSLTVGTREYREVQVRQIDAVTVQVTHAEGIAKLPAWTLTEAQQRQFGFDPDAVARLRIAQAAAATTARKNLIMARLDAIAQEARFVLAQVFAQDRPRPSLTKNMEANRAEGDALRRELATLPLTAQEQAAYLPAPARNLTPEQKAASDKASILYSMQLGRQVEQSVRDRDFNEWLAGRRREQALHDALMQRWLNGR